MTNARFVLSTFCGVFGFALLAFGATLILLGGCLILACGAAVFQRGPDCLLGLLLGLVMLVPGIGAFALFDWLERRISLREPRLG